MRPEIYRHFYKHYKPEVNDLICIEILYRHIRLDQPFNRIFPGIVSAVGCDDGLRYDVDVIGCSNHKEGDNIMVCYPGRPDIRSLSVYHQTNRVVRPENYGKHKFYGEAVVVPLPADLHIQLVALYNADLDKQRHTYPDDGSMFASYESCLSGAYRNFTLSCKASGKTPRQVRHIMSPTTPLTPCTYWPTPYYTEYLDWLVSVGMMTTERNEKPPVMS